MIFLEKKIIQKNDDNIFGEENDKEKKETDNIFDKGNNDKKDNKVFNVFDESETKTNNNKNNKNETNIDNLFDLNNEESNSNKNKTNNFSNIFDNEEEKPLGKDDISQKKNKTTIKKENKPPKVSKPLNKNLNEFISNEQETNDINDLFGSNTDEGNGLFD